MSEQQSQKTGIRSDAQKLDRARGGYDPIPPSNPVAVSFGDRERDAPTDREAQLDQVVKKQND